jgi:hypothetical protein
MNAITRLTISWAISRGRDTYGYNICRLDDNTTGKRYRCMGGGYDMQGTVLGDWLEDTHQAELMAIANRFSTYAPETKFVRNEAPDALYGGTHYIEKGCVRLDGATGLESMIRIAEAIGLEVETSYGKRRGQGLQAIYVQAKAAS